MAETIRCSMAPVVPGDLIVFRVEVFSRLRPQCLSEVFVGFAVGVFVGIAASAAVRIWTTVRGVKT